MYIYIMLYFSTHSTQFILRLFGVGLSVIEYLAHTINEEEEDE